MLLYMGAGPGGAEAGDPGGWDRDPRDKKVFQMFLWILLAILLLGLILSYFEDAEAVAATYFWFSFRDPEKNLNLGITIIKADHKVAAHKRTHQMGLNPGGEALIIEMSDEEFEREELEAHKFYSRDDMIKLGYGEQIGE